MAVRVKSRPACCEGNQKIMDANGYIGNQITGEAYLDPVLGEVVPLGPAL